MTTFFFFFAQTGIAFRPSLWFQNRPGDGSHGFIKQAAPPRSPPPPAPSAAPGHAGGGARMGQERFFIPAPSLGTPGGHALTASAARRTGWLFMQHTQSATQGSRSERRGGCATSEGPPGPGTVASRQEEGDVGESGGDNEGTRSSEPLRAHPALSSTDGDATPEARARAHCH